MKEVFQNQNQVQNELTRQASKTYARGMSDAVLKDTPPITVVPVMGDVESLKAQARRMAQEGGSHKPKPKLSEAKAAPNVMAGAADGIELRGLGGDFLKKAQQVNRLASHARTKGEIRLGPLEQILIDVQRMPDS